MAHAPLFVRVRAGSARLASLSLFMHSLSVHAPASPARARGAELSPASPPTDPARPAAAPWQAGVPVQTDQTAPCTQKKARRRSRNRS